MSSNMLLNVLDIYLDSENPRHNPIYDQPSIIEHLLKDERVKNLARHIATHGVNPLDSIGVIKDEEGNYVVVEGNRRLCSLLLLNDPEKAPSGEVPYFKRLSESSASIPVSINCVLFDNLEEANVWMGVRHNGEQDGIGIRNWDSKQKTRHNGRVNKRDQNALALALIEYAVKKNILHHDQTDRIITTAARYVGNPFIRETFGIVSPRSESDVKINVSCSDFDKVLERFCADLVENTVVHSRTNKDDWVAYGRLLIEQSMAPKQRVKTHLLESCLLNNNSTSAGAGTGNTPPNSGSDNSSSTGNGESDKGSAGASGNGTTGDSNTRNPDNRKFIVPHDFKVAINNKILRRVFEEMKTIDIDDKPLAVSQITRAFLENLYVLYFEACTGSYQQVQTHILMDKVIKEIELDSNLSKSEKNAVAGLKRVQSNEMNALSPKTLGANAHAGIYPDPKQLKREFDNISEIIKYMLKRV